MPDSLMGIIGTRDPSLRKTDIVTSVIRDPLPSGYGRKISPHFLVVARRNNSITSLGRDVKPYVSKS